MEGAELYIYVAFNTAHRPTKSFSFEMNILAGGMKCVMNAVPAVRRPPKYMRMAQN